MLCLLHVGSEGAITMSPINKAAPSGTPRANMSRVSSLGFDKIEWTYLPVGGSIDVVIALGVNVYRTQKQDYELNQSEDQQSNVVILNATARRAGTYYCTDESQASAAQLIIFSKLSLYAT